LNEIAAADNEWLQAHYGIRLPAIEQSGIASAPDVGGRFAESDSHLA
jgi:hypothetical protein